MVAALDNGVRLLSVGVFFVMANVEQFRITKDRGKHIIKFMRKASSQGGNRLFALLPEKTLIRFLALFLIGHPV